MTEKRFKVIETITYDDRRVYELTKNDIGYYNFKGEKLLAHMICNELNILLEENEQLKQLNKEAVELISEAIVEALDGARYNVEELLEKAIELLGGKDD